MVGGKSRFFLNDTWVFSLVTFRWKRVQENCSDKTRLDAEHRPSVRWGHTAIVMAPPQPASAAELPVSQRQGGPGLTASAVVPAGFGAEGDSDAQRGSSDLTDGEERRRRTSPANSLGMMWLFGGLDGRIGMASRSLFCMHLSTHKWMRIEEGSKSPAICPSARYQHSAVSWDGSMYVFGGRDEEGVVFSDLWRFDGFSLTWSRVEAVEGNEKKKPQWPKARFGHVASVDQSSGVMCIVGGRTSCSTQDDEGLADVWEFSFVSGRWHASRAPGVKQSQTEWARTGLTGACVATDPSAGTNFFLLTGDGDELGGAGGGGRASTRASSEGTQTCQLYECWPKSAVAGTLNYIPQELAMLIFRHLPSDVSSWDFQTAISNAKHLTRVASVCARWREVLLSVEAEEELWAPTYQSLVVDPLKPGSFMRPHGIPAGDLAGTAFAQLGPDAPGSMVSKIALFHRARNAHLEELRSKIASADMLYTPQALRDMVGAASIAVQMNHLKLVLVGTGAVGKTCAMISYTTNAFPGEYIPTLFDTPSCNVMVSGIPCCATIWDTAGQEDYDRLRPLSYPQTDCFIMMYDCVSRDSLRLLQEKFVPEVRHHCPEAVIIFAANKVDLRNDSDTLDKLHAKNLEPVSIEEGEAIAAGCGAFAHVENSALTQKGLKDLFDSAIALSLLKQNHHLPGTRKKRGKGGCPVQ